MIILTGSDAKVANNAKDADLILEIISEVKIPVRFWPTALRARFRRTA
jgi:hypothetical protein